MEKESSGAAKAKKLGNIVKIVLVMLRKGLSESKVIADLSVLLKRSKVAGKAISDLMLHHHYSAFSCRSDDVRLSFVSPREYEFSCSNTPIYLSKRKNHHRVDYISAAIHNVFVDEGSPAMALPGFGMSPVVRQLRITDSPFPLKDGDEEDDDAQVDKAAEEFISKFYRDLRRQTRMAALESPSPYHIWAT
ncbi:uncharacterized protein LOC127795402 [Diospyros lotus]|uniref:uncharacterized protein LOC127795402 n=1 Tax=Diospyros lotus TaxID=55363 RepID=UPI00224FD718|nr:uncharacterized protein LOC127795402 [Diospyros lotus]